MYLKHLLEDLQLPVHEQMMKNYLFSKVTIKLYTFNKLIIIYCINDSKGSRDQILLQKFGDQTNQ